MNALQIIFSCSSEDSKPIMEKKFQLKRNLSDPIHLQTHLDIQSISIDSLGLSVRASNCLKQAGIKFVSELDGITPEALFRIRNMGVKSVGEICEMLDLFRNFDSTAENDLTAECNTKFVQAEAGNIVVIRNPQGILYEDMRIEELKFSARSYNVLKRNGINTLKNLMELSEETLRTFRNLGNKSVMEIMQKKDFYVKQYEWTIVGCLSDQDKTLCNSITAELKFILTHMPEEKISVIVGGVISNYRKSNPSSSSGDESPVILDELFSNLMIRNGLITTIYEQLDEWNPKSYSEVIAEMRTLLYKGAIIESIISEMFEAKLIEIKDGIVHKHHDSVFEAVEKIKNDRNREILQARLSGLTLEAVGNNFNLTRERVRQISLKELKKIKGHRVNTPAVKIFIEDKYSSLFQKYYFSKEDFCAIFKVPQTTYHYLSSMHSRGTLPFSDFLNCGYLSDEEKGVYCNENKYNKIFIDGQEIEKNKKDLAHFVLKKYCQQTVSLPQFIEYYNLTLSNLNLADQKKLQANSFSIANILSLSMDALWKRGKRLRYYNINEYDYTDFLDTLHLEQYQNVEYSAYKFFRDYPQLMKEYDIQDEYELHNLLKKILSDNVKCNIKFDRMPTLEFGIPNRNTQVLKLLATHAPITNVDLANLYEEQYGVQAATVLANYFKNFDMYFHNGVYTLDFPRMPEAQYEQMKEWFVDDFYFMRDLEHAYLKKVKDADLKYFNPHNIKRFGYKTYSDYVIKDSYNSASDYFRCLLTEQETVNLKDIIPGVRTIPSYLSEFQKLKDSYEVLEINPTYCINVSQINKKGYDKKDIEDYCDKVVEYVRPGEYFTIKTLRNKGFYHPLNQLEYGDWFYGSLLASASDRLKSKRIGGTRIFLNSVRDIAVPDLIKYTMRAKEVSNIRLGALARLLWEEYGIHFERQKISAIIKDSVLDYDSNNDTVCYNFGSVNL